MATGAYGAEPTTLPVGYLTPDRPPCKGLGTYPASNCACRASPRFCGEALKAIKGDAFRWDGLAHVRFLNLADRRVVGVGLKNVTSPDNDEPITGIAQYAKGPLGTRVYRFLSRVDLVGGEGREWFGARAAWHRGVGGAMQAVVAGGDVPAPPGRYLVTACWDKDLEPVRIDAEPDVAEIPEKGEVGDCIEEFTSVAAQPVDPDSPEAWEDGGDFEVEELPSEAESGEDSAAGAAPGE